MNYEIGQKVKLVKAGCNGDVDCCKNQGYVVGETYTITGVGDVRITLKSSHQNCSFSFNCVKPLNDSLKSLLED